MTKCNKCELCTRSKHRTEEEKKHIKRRLNTIEGQVRGVSKMIDDDKYCNDVLSVENLDTTECSSYTDKKNVFINSVIDYNRTKEDTN